MNNYLEAVGGDTVSMRGNALALSVVAEGTCKAFELESSRANSLALKLGLDPILLLPMRLRFVENGF